MKAKKKKNSGRGILPREETFSSVRVQDKGGTGKQETAVKIEKDRGEEGGE